MPVELNEAAPALPGTAVSIRTLREQRAILDSDLAALYGVEIKRFNEQIKRNPVRFLTDFMFQLTAEEFESLRSQFATLKKGRGGIASIQSIPRLNNLGRENPMHR